MNRLRLFLSGLLLSASVALGDTPTLQCQIANSQASLVWPLTGRTYTLESTTDLVGGSWTAVATAPTQTSSLLSVTMPLASQAQFFRLHWTDPGDPNVVVAINDNDPDLIQYAQFNCPTGTSGGCKIVDILGSDANEFDAGASTVAGTDNSALSFQWQIRYPPSVNGGVLYTHAGIAGANQPMLTIQPDSFPNLSAYADQYWRVTLIITSHAGPMTRTRIVYFKFRYVSSA